jgi:kexin
MLEKQKLRRRVKRDSSLVERQVEDGPVSASRAVANRLGIRDPIFSQQWHIVNDYDGKHMMNVTGVWEMGITGEGVISAMVDDGLDFESDDLAANFVSPFSSGLGFDSSQFAIGCCWLIRLQRSCSSA